MSTDGFPETRVTSSVTEAQILALKKEIEQLDSELKRLEERLSEATETSCHTKIDELEKKSSRVNRILGLVIVVSSSLTVWLMVRPGYPSTAEGVGGTDLRN
jgi:hypothetical protein